MWLWFIKFGAEHWSWKAWVICWKDFSSTHLDGRVLCRCHCLDSSCPASKVPVIRVPRSTRAGHRLRRRGCPTHYCWRKKLMINRSNHARTTHVVHKFLHNCQVVSRVGLVSRQLWSVAWVGLRRNVLHFIELKSGDKTMLFVSGTFLFISAFFSLRWVAF